MGTVLRANNLKGWIVAGWVVATAGFARGQVVAPDVNRLVHEFDFDERDEGNLEPLPKYWVRFDGEGFPRFTSGSFDENVGHEAPPSFKLDSDGRNVAFRYLGDGTRIRTNSDYIITGWVRGDGLVHARAALSAYYLDRDRLPILKTQVFSALVGGDGNDASWRRVEVFLPAGPENARTIGLTAWVVQSPVWDVGPAPRRHIDMLDVGAGAWFDDISIFRLPRVSIKTEQPGNVLAVADATVRVTISDVQSEGISASVDFFDVTGGRLMTRSVPVDTSESPVPTTIDVSALGVGLHRARVRVESDGRPLADRWLTFATVNPHSSDQPGSTRGFGVVLDPANRADPLTELSLVKRLNAGAVKIPVWTGIAAQPDLPDADDAMDTLLYELLKGHVSLVGVLAGAPSEVVQEAGAYPRPLLTMLTEPADSWRDYLVRVVAPYASIFRTWQIGRDDDAGVMESRRLGEAVIAVRREMEALTSSPHLTVPESLTLAPADEPPAADDLCLTIDDSIDPEFFGSYLEGYRTGDRHPSSVFIQQPAPGETNPVSELRSWCKRLVQAAGVGVDTIYVPQPWNTRRGATGPVTEPTARFCILHTLIDVLGDCHAGARVHLGPGITAMTFHRRESTVLVVWDDAAGAEGSAVDLQLGSASEQVDIWGRRSPLVRGEDGRSRVLISSEPTYIPNVERWLVEFRTAMGLSPDRVEFSYDGHEHELTMVNPRDIPIAGHVQFDVPNDWEIRPRQFRFSIPPGGRTTKSVSIRFARDETAGAKTVLARVELDAGEHYLLEVPLTVELGSADIDAWGLAVVEGNRLVIRHGVTNRSSEPLSFRSTAIIPGRPRQTRPLPNCLPGQTLTATYFLRDASKLRGRTVRLQLRELDGPRIHNISVDVQ